MRHSVVGSVVVLSGSLAFSACDSSTVVSSGGGGGSTGGGTNAGGETSAGGSMLVGGSGGSSQSGGAGGGDVYDKSECAGPQDCPGGACIEVNGGYHLCQYVPAEATVCSGSALDECCDSSECTAPAQCFPAPLTAFCGGPQMEDHNECGTNFCEADADCADGVCMPPGTVGNAVSVCVARSCTGTLCGQESLSSCALVREPCCGGPLGFMCIDETTGCQFNNECPQGYCDQGVCSAGTPLCPG